LRDAIFFPRLVSAPTLDRRPCLRLFPFSILNSDMQSLFQSWVMITCSVSGNAQLRNLINERASVSPEAFPICPGRKLPFSLGSFSVGVVLLVRLESLLESKDLAPQDSFFDSYHYCAAFEPVLRLSSLSFFLRSFAFGKETFFDFPRTICHLFSAPRLGSLPRLPALISR